jgi:hypothetical protein
VPPLEAWEHIYVKEAFLDSDHGKLGCYWCHSGNKEVFDDKEAAHEGLIAYPSEDPENYCAPCHQEETENNTTGIHTTQQGFYERFRIRAGYDLQDGKQEHILIKFKSECGKCHTSCGQCHVSRPRTVGGGLNWAHEFLKTPDMQTNCTACHGSRIGEEYRGEHDAISADVHYLPLLKKCEYCHSAHEMHGGDGNLLKYRYDVDNTAAPKCENCHSYAEQINTYHQMHWSGNAGVTLSCQVCHSQQYKNCNGCHVAEGRITGSSYLSFEIGRNYLKDNERYKNYDYITVRHIPIAPNTFEAWGVSDLANFETSEATWKMTTPHNIRRWTPQTQVPEGNTCSSRCHGSNYYLRPEDIDYYEAANYNEETAESGYGYDNIERERQANKDVIIPY